MYKYKIWTVLVALVLLFSTASWVLADDNPPPVAPPSNDKDDQVPALNGADPNYVPSTEELKTLAAKEASLMQHMQQRVGPENYGYHIVYVGTWLEPDDFAHRNYCGPGATQVALDARLSASQIPSVDVIGQEENIDPNSGVTTQAIRNVLNARLNTTWYGVSGSGSSTELWNRIVINIDNGYALVTALMTGNMPGWGTRDVKHIVAVYGYNQGYSPPHYVYYTETSRASAGFNGNYWNSERRGPFWNYVSRNDSQVW